jgi:hypothetical protein
LSTERSGILGAVDAHNHFDPAPQQLTQAPETPSVNIADPLTIHGDARTWTNDGAGGAQLKTPAVTREQTTEENGVRTTTTLQTPSVSMYIPVAHVVAFQGSSKYSLTLVPQVYTTNVSVLTALGSKSPYSLKAFASFMDKFAPEVSVFSGDTAKPQVALRLLSQPVASMQPPGSP